MQAFLLLLLQPHLTRNFMTKKRLIVPCYCRYMLCCLTRNYLPRDSLSSGIFLLARIAINHDNYQLRLNPTLLQYKGLVSGSQLINVSTFFMNYLQ